MSAGMKNVILLPLLCIMLSHMVSQTTFILLFLYYCKLRLCQISPTWAMLWVFKLYSSQSISLNGKRHLCSSCAWRMTSNAAAGDDIYGKRVSVLRLQVRSAAASVRAPPCHLSAPQVWAWCWMAVAAAGCAPNRWGSCALRKMSVTHTKASPVTLVPPTTDA